MDLGPLRAYEPGQGRRDLLLRPGPIIELTIGTKDIPRRLHSFPNRFPLLIQFESLERLRPSLMELLRQLSLATALPSGLFKSSAGSFGPFPGPFHPRPYDPQRPMSFPLGMEDIQSLLRGNFVGLASEVLHPDNSRLESRARVGCHIAQRGPGLQFRTPG